MRASISDNPEIIKLCKKRRNYVVNLRRKVKTEYFQLYVPHGASSIKKWCVSDKLSDGPFVNATRKNENHLSIIKIKSSVETTQLFDFNFVNNDGISKIINSLNPTKTTSVAVPTKIVKLANKQICKDLTNCINERIKKDKLPNEREIGDITMCSYKSSRKMAKVS